MKRNGNKVANSIFEAKMPKKFKGRPTELEAQAMSYKLKKFIRDKYDKKM